MLHQVVKEHLATFVEDASRRGDSAGLPRFVERELSRFLECGVLANAFAQVRCGDCRFERLVPFSCCLQPETMRSSGARGGCSSDYPMSSLQIVSCPQAKR